MTSSRLIPQFFDTSQASLSNSSASLDGNKSEISPSAIPNILALPAILPAVLSLPANVVALLGPNDFPDFPPGFGAAALGFKVVPSGLTPGFGVVPSGFGAASYFHPSHLKVDPDGGGAAGGAVNVVLAIDPALAFTLGAAADSVAGAADSVAGALVVVPSHLKVDPDSAVGAGALAALSLAALYLAYLSAPYIVPAPTAVTAPAVPTTSPNALNGSTG